MDIAGVRGQRPPVPLLGRGETSEEDQECGYHEEPVYRPRVPRIRAPLPEPQELGRYGP